MGLIPQVLLERYLRSEAEEIAGIAAREVAKAMRPGENMGFDPELVLIQIENASRNIDTYPAHRAESAEREPEMKRALRNWRIMHNTRWQPPQLIVEDHS